MNSKQIGSARYIYILSALLLLCLFLSLSITPITASASGSASAGVTALEVNPEEILPGDTLSISGKASPNDEIWINSVFELSLSPTYDARYSREFTGIYFPAGEKSFTLTAENVENIRISLSPVFWRTVEFPLDGPLNATDGTATISIAFPVIWSGMPFNIEGEKNVNVFGDAIDNVTPVNLQVTMAIKVIADSNGYFSLEIDTGGVPKGEFLISAGRHTKTVSVVTKLTPAPDPEPDPKPDPEQLTPAPAPAPPNIISFAPLANVSDTEGATRTFKITIDQTVDVSWQINGTEVQTKRGVTEASYTNLSAVAGVWNVSAIVSNTDGTDVQTWIWNVTAAPALAPYPEPDPKPDPEQLTPAPAPAPPNIISFAPLANVSDTEGATRTFKITIDQTVDVSWQINGTEVQTKRGVTEASYTNLSAVAGVWNVSAIVSNADGTDVQTWIWNVTAAPAATPAQQLIPGFTALSAIVGLLLLTYLMLKRKRY
ncbi:MAG: hypothetical protein H0M93_02705 [Methanophagales archaeon]|nr:hypothetical protein [Methanophagales archaeon]